jgi:glycosyltransferase involved in cell wall biosynthesis
MIRALAEEGHRLTVVVLSDADGPPGDLTPLRRVVEHLDILPSPRGLKRSEIFRRLAAVPQPIPYNVGKFRARDYAHALAEHLARTPFDILICDGVYNFQNLPVDRALPVLLNKDDIAHVILERTAAIEPHPGRRLYLRLEALKVKRWERLVCSHVTAVLACSRHDAHILSRLAPTARIFTVPNVVDTDHYVPMGTAEHSTVLFQGGLDWHPNRDAVEFFASQILPRLRRSVPHIVFRVAGRSPDDAFRRRWQKAGVTFTGSVPDMRHEIARATVCVVPLRTGSGTRLKILEAAAMEKALVSTRLGAEGLDFVNREDICLVDSPLAFVDVLTSLLSDGPRRLTMGRAARLRVEKQYGLPTLKCSLRESLDAPRQ